MSKAEYNRLKEAAGLQTREEQQMSNAAIQIIIWSSWVVFSALLAIYCLLNQAPIYAGTPILHETILATKIAAIAILTTTVICLGISIYRCR